ncbi:MAG TPA: Rrf2 family transcriptional regulator [Gammaproteobacteria bacterium]|nr:Rrf2 family transcriptional regulator [Gammaproteobacteria bacterium]
MQLTRFTDYSLRVLISVGLSGERGVTIGEIAKQYGISRNHLMKVVQGLARAGYLETLRGKGGGLRLALPAADINLGEVVREAESLNVVPCFEHGGDKPCAIAPVCILSRVVREALQAFLAVLDRYTLADLLEPGHTLQRLLLGNLLRRGADEATPDPVI